MNLFIEPRFALEGSPSPADTVLFCTSIQCRGVTSLRLVLEKISRKERFLAATLALVPASLNRRMLSCSQECDNDVLFIVYLSGAPYEVNVTLHSTKLKKAADFQCAFFSVQLEEMIRYR